MYSTSSNLAKVGMNEDGDYDLDLPRKLTTLKYLICQSALFILGELRIDVMT